jgi:hypothetical protein
MNDLITLAICGIVTYGMFRISILGQPIFGSIREDYDTDYN